MRLRVKGDSMLPTLKAGDLVLVNKNAFKTTLPKAGDVVVAWHPNESQLAIIKRVASITPAKQIDLRSDNPLGSDSRQFGVLSLDKIIGKVTAHSAK